MSNCMKKILQDFLDNSSAEQLREELKKGSRPFFQMVEDSAVTIRYPKCKVGILDTMHDQHGLYVKCPHCKWDSAGLYKTKNKYEK